MADTVIFLDIDIQGNKGFTGESKVEGFADKIEVESVSWEMTAKQIQEKSSKQMRTELRPGRLKLSKFFDSASTKLASWTHLRTPFTTATLTFADLMIQRDQAKRGRVAPVVKIVLESGYIEEIKLSASESGRSVAIKEDVELSFECMRLYYAPIDPRTNTRGAAMDFQLDQPSQA